MGLRTQRVSSFTAQVGLGSLLLSLDGRWSSWRLLLRTFLVATALLLVGTIRAWGDFDHNRAATWLFLASLVGLALAIVVLYRNMGRAATSTNSAWLSVVPMFSPLCSCAASQLTRPASNCTSRC